MNEQKILDALEYIKEICENHDCRHCPLSNENANRCMVRNYDPCDWVLTNQLPKKWSAFVTKGIE